MQHNKENIGSHACDVTQFNTSIANQFTDKLGTKTEDSKTNTTEKTIIWYLSLTVGDLWKIVLFISQSVALV